MAYGDRCSKNRDKVWSMSHRLRDFTHYLLVAKSLAFRKIIYAPSDYLVDMLIREMKEAEQCSRFSVTM